MARTAVSELQQQIEEVRREAFAAGYAAAMQAIRELASRPATDARPATTRRGRRGGGGRKPGETAPSRQQRDSLREGAERDRRSASSTPQPGSNPQSIEAVHLILT